jgi:ABC-type transport system involved in cytochrome bd biosynthesis fused ATPase/permease subunit
MEALRNKDRSAASNAKLKMAQQKVAAKKTATPGQEDGQEATTQEGQVMTSGSLKPILVGVGSGTLGSVIANQIPQNQHQSHLADKIKPHHKKGKIKKALVPVSDDPYFNQAAAQKAFDLVMKMDDDTAEVFTQLVVSDMFEQTVEENLDTLQRHLNDVLAKRADMIKRALVRVAKSADDPEVKAYAEAVDKDDGHLQGQEPVQLRCPVQRVGLRA